MTRVGLLGDGAAAVADTVRDAGGDTVVGDDALEGDVDALVALGEPALLAVLDASSDAPVLPVDAGREYEDVNHADLQDAVVAVSNGDYGVRDQPTLSMRTGNRRVRALADVLLVTREPARISEYAVEADGDVLDAVRADGVVAATPAGSHGYAADAGGPLLSRDAGALSVVPVAPFRVERARWVLDPPVTIRVVRDRADVALLVDGRYRGVATPHESVEFDWGDPLPVVVPASADSRAPVE